MPRIKILAQKEYYNNWATLTEYKLQYTSESLNAEMTRVAFDSGDGAAVFLHNPDTRTILFVRQFRFAAYFNTPDESIMLEVCAGIIEDDDPSKTAMREVLEETGYNAQSIQKVGEVYVSPGAHTEKIHLYIATYSDDNRPEMGGGVDSENEDIEIVEFSYEEVFKMYEEGKVRDAKTLILIQYWILTHLR